MTSPFPHAQPSWRDVMAPELEKQYFRTLESFLASEKGTIYPPREATFRAFNECPFESVRVVLLGQDPYHGPGQAMGLCFSVPRGVKVPSSLQNMYKELEVSAAQGQAPRLYGLPRSCGCAWEGHRRLGLAQHAAPAAYVLSQCGVPSRHTPSRGCRDPCRKRNDKRVKRGRRGTSPFSQSDLGAPRPPHGDLRKWAKQGVFMLNTTLTVRAASAGSHAKVRLPSRGPVGLRRVSDWTCTRGGMGVCDASPGAIEGPERSSSGTRLRLVALCTST